jgi:hypothetical protein
MRLKKRGREGKEDGKMCHLLHAIYAIHLS